MKYDYKKIYEQVKKRLGFKESFEHVIFSFFKEYDSYILMSEKDEGFVAELTLDKYGNVVKAFFVDDEYEEWDE